VEDLEQGDLFAYKRIYERLRDVLSQLEEPSTEEITFAIKAFFRCEYEDQFVVLCSGGQHSEYMVDVLVTSFTPKSLIEKGTLALSPNRFDVHLAVESELGGVSASGPYGVMKNAAEDFLKLLLINARRRVMIMTSLAFRKESEHVDARVETLRKMYAAFPNACSGVLIVHLAGSRPRSTQVQTATHLDAIRAFVVEENGMSVSELRP
jgi:hypothetical protein